MTKNQAIKQIREQMKLQGYSVTTLSNKITANRTTLARNLTQETQMSLETYIEICKVLNIKLKTLCPKKT